MAHYPPVLGRAVRAEHALGALKKAVARKAYDEARAHAAQLKAEADAIHESLKEA